MKHLSKTKIVATIGPASSSKKVLTQMIESGLDIARFNFSHAKYDLSAKWIGIIRAIAKKKKREVKILQDLQGPRIRLGADLPEKGLPLKKGAKIKIGFGKFKRGFLPIDYKGLVDDIKIGTLIMLSDGTVELEVIKKEKNSALAKVLVGGKVFSRKGVNIPNANLKISPITEKDKADIKWGLKNEVDYIALSFVKDEKDMKELRKLTGGKVKLIAKIERPQALKNLKKILKFSDGVMVARGDLGIELHLEKIPNAQRKIIDVAHKTKKLVIVATQMMESMLNNPQPTRAEVSDIDTAVIEKADAVMLSEETAIGKYPVEAVRVMEKICKEAEKE
ncbi:MAG: pyruvate kinase [Patescibacteria group bacterium]|nr:pyruvate kinase [Patescibacteria group bacterium]